MKISANDLDDLRDAISKVLIEKPEAAKMYKTKGLTEDRFRWDVFHATKINEKLNLYEYLNDAHISTALRHIMPSPYEGV